MTREVTEHNTVIPGTNVSQDSELLTVELNANGSPLKQDMHEYGVNGQWFWATTDDAMKALIAGKCFTMQ